jgi:hypothetical protein
MNPTGRIVGGGLILLSLLWILRIAGLTPFSDRSANQVASAQVPPDRPPIADFDASRTTIANFNPPTGSQGFGAGSGTSGSGTSTIGDLATNPGSGTTTSTTGAGTSTGGGTSGSSTGSTSTGGGTAGTTPAVRAGW